MQSSLGVYLKSEREGRGIDLPDVAAETRVPEAALRLIEEDRWDELPGEVFVRGFLRAYARCVGLEPEDMVRRLDRPAPRPTMPWVNCVQVDLRRRRIASPALFFVLALASLLIVLVLWRPVAAPSFSVQLPTPTAGKAG
jgi:cytoskeletal protein RodZ